jgi:hypothetical protein
VLVARTANADGDEAGLRKLRAAFVASNPGYDLFVELDATRVTRDAPTVLFVQVGQGLARVAHDDARAPSGSAVAVGDVVLLRTGETLDCAPAIGVVGFELPDALPLDLPTFVRPDWDPLITDTPGGCATETGAYRRMLLTWLPENGPYVLDVDRALNAHRVRITDSFTHYHPIQGGFDELYLVQMVQPGARLLTCDDADAVEQESVTRERAGELFDVHELAVGDLVYLPRGTIHRGLGGVLAQIIAVPGFVPGTEVGVDEHLRALNRRLELTGADALEHHTPR